MVSTFPSIAMAWGFQGDILFATPCAKQNDQYDWHTLGILEYTRKKYGGLIIYMYIS
jgi:hypothetical protein